MQPHNTTVPKAAFQAAAARTSRRVNVDFQLAMLAELDRETERLGIARQALIKMWISDKLAELKLRNSTGN